MRTAPAPAPWFLPLVSLLLAATAARAAGPSRRPAELFGLTRVWELHLTVGADDWRKMQPTRGGFPGFGGGGAPKPLPEGRVVRGNFGFDFAHVKADLVIGDATFRDVAVRFKGSGTYAMSQRLLKRPFKVDLGRHVAGRSFRGVRRLVLNNNVMDATCAREALAFAVYRAAGVPAPRTAYAVVRLSVPGKYDRELLGVYTLAEEVDRTFLRSRFGDHKGLLLKPERVGPLEHLGTDWDEYDARYRPKTRASAAARKKLIALTRLVGYADDERFRAEVGKYLDVDGFLRYLAATVLLSSTDSFAGLAHNYYLYLDRKQDRFVIIPWDADLAFAGLPLGGVADLMDLSIRQPQLGRNPLVERLLEDEGHFAAYKGHLRKLLKGGFTEEAITRDLAAITAAVGPARAKEKKASAARKEPAPSLGLWMPKPPELVPFVRKRVASVRAQLEGKSPGKPMRAMWGMPGGAPTALVRAVLKRADADGDKRLSRREVAAGVRALLKHFETTGAPLDEKGLTAALAAFVPRPAAPPWGFGGAGAGGAEAKDKKADKPKGAPKAEAPWPQVVDLARSMVERGGRGGKVSRELLLAAADTLFTKHDRDRDGQLDEKELAAALQELLPSPPFRMPPAGGPGRKGKGAGK
jgi:spore coat protein H